MPTLSLYDPAPPHPDGWHRVTAPGGYETWHLDAEDDAGDVRILVTFSQGSPFDGEYRRRYAQFLRKPTKRLPPRPGEFPSVTFVLWERGETLARFAYRYPAEAFDATPSEPQVQVGGHRLVPGAGGTLAVTVAEVAIEGGAARLSAELWFTPRFVTKPFERRYPARDVAGADHFWVIANPQCAVSGIVRIQESGDPTPPLRELHFSGRGYHDHRYGTAPLYASRAHSGARGRVLSDSGADVFQFAGADGKGCCFKADASGIHEISLQPTEPSAKEAGQLILPDGTSLQSPTEVDLNPFAIVRAYEVVRDGKTAGTALVETARHGFSFPKGAGDFEDAP